MTIGLSPVSLPAGPDHLLPAVVKCDSMSGTSNPDVLHLSVTFENGALGVIPASREALSAICRHFTTWEEVEAIRRANKQG